MIQCINAHQFVHSKMSLSCLKEIFRCLKGNVVMFITENVVTGLEFISCFSFSHKLSFYSSILFWRVGGGTSVCKLISLDDPFLLEDT